MLPTHTLDPSPDVTHSHSFQQKEIKTPNKPTEGQERQRISIFFVGSEWNCRCRIMALQGTITTVKIKSIKRTATLCCEHKETARGIKSSNAEVH